MGIVQLECPECGAPAEIGIPIDAAVEDVDATAAALPDGEGKRRAVACERGHEVHVYFESSDE